MVSRRLLMTFARAVTKSISSPGTQISHGRLLKSSRLPFIIPVPLKSVIGPLQIRIPEIVSSRRPSYVLQAQLMPQMSMEQPGKRGPVAPGHPQPKKRKTMSPEIEVRLAIQMAARERSIEDAFAAYDRAKEQNIKLTSDSYACIMFLCSGGDNWENILSSTAHRSSSQNIAEKDPNDEDAEKMGCISNPSTTGTVKVTSQLMQRGRDLLHDMNEAGLRPNEIFFTALARMEALAGNPDAAFQVALSMAEKGLPLKLRCFTPALVAFAERGDGPKAFQVDAAITSAGLEIGENEYGRLLQASRGGSVGFDHIENILHRMSRELTTLQPLTIERARNCFTSLNTTSNSTAPWTVELCTVENSGACAAAGKDISLTAIDLTEEEYSEFKSGIASLASKQERQPDEFGNFVRWLEEHGPFDVVVDAANVAFYGQNYESGGFNFAQIGAVVDRMKETHPESRILVILHINRTKASPAQASDATALLDSLRSQKSFFASPAGSNDDWYWMYAAVAAGCRGLLVSNDEMRDHLFHMLSPRFFGKWKQRHQLKYRFSGSPSSLELDYPPPYTACVQKLRNGAWVLPCVDGTWTLAIQRPQE